MTGRGLARGRRHRDARPVPAAVVAALLVGLVLLASGRRAEVPARRPLGPVALAASSAPVAPRVTFSVASSYTVGGPGSVTWSFPPPAGNGYEGWSEAWDTAPSSPAFTADAGWLATGSLSGGVHHVVLAFFFAGRAPVVVTSPAVDVVGPSVNWQDQGTFVEGSTARVDWSFTPPASAGYLGWSEAWDATPTAPSFAVTSGWLAPGSLPVGLHRVTLAFFFAGQAPVVVTSPPVAVVAAGAPAVRWSAPNAATAGTGSGALVSWSFPPPQLAGYRGWSQSWDRPATAPSFAGEAGWLQPGDAAPGERSALVTFFDGSGSLVEASPPVSVGAPTVTWHVAAAYREGGTGGISWSFPDGFGDGYEGWSQSYDSPAGAPHFRGGVGWEPAGGLQAGTHQAVVTFFWAGRGPVAVTSPSFTVRALPVSWVAQSSYVEGSGDRVSWSFTAPAVPGFEGWAQSFDQPSLAPSFTGTAGWLAPGSQPTGTQRVFLTFFTTSAPPFVVESPPLTVRPDYPPGATGYDVSFAQCGAAYPAGSHTVAIVGVTGGAAFSANPCLASEATWAGPGLNLYLNVNQPSWTDPSRADTGPQAQCARSDSSASGRCQGYDYGWNDAQYALDLASSQGVQATVWWLDVECPASSCSWSTSYWSTNLADNAAVIEGAIAALRTAGDVAGVYSTSYQWGAIAGTATPGVPVWYAGWSAPASSYCSSSSARFTGGPVWLVQQNPDQTDGVYDPDTAC